MGARGILAGLALWAAGCFATTDGRTGFVGRQDVSDQEVYAESLAPAELEAGPGSDTPNRKLSLRIYADEDYARATLGWQVRVYDQIGRANRVLAGRFGVTLEIVEIKPWARKTMLSGLSLALDELAAHDPADDVDVVLGLLPANDVVTPAIHQLGMGRVLGRHLVLRGMDDDKEFDALAQALGKISLEDRERLYADRVKHKETVVLLHELGHLFGALHEEPTSALMRSEYSAEASVYSEPNAELMHIVLSARGGADRRNSRESEMRARLHEQLKASRYEGWTDHGRELMLALLEGKEDQLAHATDRDLSPSEAPEREANKGRSSARDPNQAEDPLQTASRLAAEGKLDAAWAIVEPIAAARSKDGPVQTYACQLQARREPKADATLARCRAARDLADDDPSPALTLAFLLLETQREAAFAEVSHAADRIGALKSPDAQLWIALAGMYRSLWAPTLAERAIAHVPEAEELRTTAEWSKKLRQQAGLDEDAGAHGLLPELEPAYFSALVKILELLSQGHRDQAVSANQALSTRFPLLPAADAELCQELTRTRVYDQAKHSCEQAAAHQPKNARPRLLLGFIALSTGKAKAGIAPLEAALSLAPDDEGTWKLLSAVYRAAGKGSQASQLAARYRERFGKAL